jgi:hypothetical protein
MVRIIAIYFGVATWVDNGFTHHLSESDVDNEGLSRTL